MTMMVMVLGECLWSFSSARAKGDGSGFGRRVILFCPRVMWPTCKLFLIYNVAQCAYLLFVTCTTCSAGVKFFSLVSKMYAFLV